MKLNDELKGCRMNLVQAAELAQMHVAHFRRLIRRGVLPSPKRTTKGRPYFDYDLLLDVAGVLKTGIGKNGEEIVFYRRKVRERPARRPSRSSQSPAKADQYLTDLAEGLRQVGVPEESLTPAKLNTALAAAFGNERPDLATAIPVLVQRLMGS